MVIQTTTARPTARPLARKGSQAIAGGREVAMARTLLLPMVIKLLLRPSSTSLSREMGKPPDSESLSPMSVSEEE